VPLRFTLRLGAITDIAIWRLRLHAGNGTFWFPQDRLRPDDYAQSQECTSRLTRLPTRPTIPNASAAPPTGRKSCHGGAVAATGGGLDWFASYDTIGNIAQTRHDEQELQALIRRDAPDAPILRVVGFGTPVAEAAAVILAHPLDGASRPSYGLGGLAIQRYNATADAWYQELLDMLEGADEAALRGVALHLFGIGKPSWILRSKRALIVSFDSSGPGRMAGIAGWRGIAAHYTPIYGVSAEKLQCSRDARLSFHLCRYRRSVGLPWTHVDQSLFLDDHREPAGIQHTLILDDAILARDGYGGMSAESLPNTRRHASAFRS